MKHHTSSYINMKLVDLQPVLCAMVTLLVIIVSSDNYDGYKKILYLTPFGERAASSDWTPINHKCKHDNCLMTTNSNKQNEADVIIFRRFIDFENVDNKRNHEHQIWVYYVNESPYSLTVWRHIQNSHIMINWTATYRLDGTLYMPLAEAIRLDKPNGMAPNMAALRERKVAWLVSHCRVHNERIKYARELQRYIDVDIYGQCGDIPCIGGRSNHTCKTQTLKKYKFYLAFENTNCKDYVTEKFWVNSLKNGILPIVMGAHKSTYTKIAPPNSFIHVDDFNSPQHLAEYLHKLDNDDELYNEYFKWMSEYRLTSRPDIMCQVCEFLHTMRGITTWYYDMGIWFNDTCITPSKENPYGSWKIAGYT